MSNSANTFSLTSKPGKTTAFFVCVLVATFLWLVKSLNTVYTERIRIPVEFRNIPPNKKPLSSIPEFLNIEVKASGLKLFFILMNQPFKKIEVDFNELKSNRKNYVITPSSLDLKQSLRFEAQVKQISPDTLYFMDNSGFQKHVPVKAVYSISCARGYGFKAPIINPGFISIVGDSISIRKTDTIYTQSMILDDLSVSVQKSLGLIRPNDNIYMNIGKVDVNIQVEKLLEHEIEIPLRAIGVPDLARSVHLFPARARVKFTALQNDFSLSDTSNFKAAVDCGKINDNKSRIFLSTQPGNVNVLSIEPAEAEILIIKK